MQQLLENEGISVKQDQVVDFNTVFWDPNTGLPPLKLKSKLLFRNRLKYICKLYKSALEMKFNKQDVVEALKTITAPGGGENLIDSKAVSNIMVFGDEIDIDVRLTNPSLQARKIRGNPTRGHSSKGSPQSQDQDQHQSR